MIRHGLPRPESEFRTLLNENSLDHSEHYNIVGEPNGLIIDRSKVIVVFKTNTLYSLTREELS